ncbi:MAG: hypothetical protein E6K65_18075 [Nitrospirae bacterium]|nr:MAG: hypothetical protein E6K65_18075 [Nitrospirota bacterium]
MAKPRVGVLLAARHSLVRLSLIPRLTPHPPPTPSSIGNRRSHIYHRPDCPNYSQIAPKNRVEFNSAEEAEAAGYRVATNCR